MGNQVKPQWQTVEEAYLASQIAASRTVSGKPLATSTPAPLQSAQAKKASK